MNKIRHCLAGVFVGFGRLLAQIMHPAVDVAVLVQVIVPLSVDDAQRLLRGGSIVEIDQRLAINLLVENGDLGAYFVDVHFIVVCRAVVPRQPLRANFRMRLPRCDSPTGQIFE